MDGEPAFKAICDLIPEAMELHHVPGVAVGLLCEGREFAAGFGVTNVRHPLPVTEKTLFQIGSTTKTFTGTAVMRLVEMGKLDLDTPIRAYLPDFKMRDDVVTERVSMRHLLTHTGGWEGDYFSDTGDGDDALGIYVREMAELPQITPLDTIWSYNNAAFSLAGHVIAAVTGQSYEAALKELVIGPLGLKRSLVFPADVMTHRFAVGHAVRDGTAFPVRPWKIPRSAWPAGGIAASIEDQLRYARFHLGDGCAQDGTRLLRPETLALMHQPVVPSVLDQEMALSWMTRTWHGVRIVFHGGGTLGQISSFTFLPERNFALAVNTNAGSGGMMAMEATREAIAELVGFKEPEPIHIPMSAAQLAEYAGLYRAALQDFEIKLDGDHLVLQTIPKGGFPTKETPAGPRPPATRMAFIGIDHVITLDPPLKDMQAEFLRNPNGQLAWFRASARIHKRT